MSKYLKSILSCVLIVCILMSTLLTVDAEKEKPQAGTQIHIENLQDFIDFSKKCRMDSYSKKLTVHLDADIDLSKTEFSSIPIFFGTFLGNNHTIKGVNIKADGSEQGLFRFLKDSATVKDLTVEGKIIAQGKCESVGAIAGNNSGKIINCVFAGELGGADCVGGIAGVNTITGVVENSSAEGTIYGKHFVGGIVGENKGVVRKCLNYASVNTTEQQNIVDISNITVNSITGTEALNTVTDIGGIAGSSCGVIRECKNYASIGYPHMGYNIGGIVGSQFGYVANCDNFAKICGRKEVGGIVGQMEPSAKIDFSKDSIKMLHDQLNTIYYRSHHISNSTHGNNAFIKNQFIDLGENAKDTIIALEKLTPEDEEGLDDPDRQQAALNVLSGSTNSMMQTMGDIYSSSKDTTLATSNDFKTIINQIDNVAATLCRPEKNLGGSYSDISDKDTKKDLTGKVESSFNYGSIDGDLNTGGIVGSIAWENDLDPEDDWNITGEMSMNFESEVRAVVLNCENYAQVNNKKRNAGGIAGYMAFGLIKDCTSTGFISAQNAKYVGGIAGESVGYLRNNNAKCEILGKSFVGGIAGSAVTVTDCRSMTYIDKVKEKSGAVLGIKGKNLAGREAEIKRNYYLIAKKDFGGIDGISYSGVAQPVGPKGFFTLPKLKEIFQKSKITFVGENGIIDIIYVPTGEELKEEDIPPVPEEHGKTGEWENLKKTDLRKIYFDLTFHTSYTQNTTTVQSRLLRSDGKPILMAQSYFSNMENFDIEKLNKLPKVGKREKIVEGWKIPIFSEAQTQLRYQIPENVDPESSKIMVRNSKGEWKETKFEQNKSYAVFTINSDSDAFCLVTKKESKVGFILLICAIVLFVLIEAVLLTFMLKKKIDKKKRA